MFSASAPGAWWASFRYSAGVPGWLYVTVCVTAPALWGLAMVKALRWWERRRRRKRADADYSI